MILVLLSSTDKNDFNASAISLLYPVDEISSVNDIPAFIPIVDDEIDEAVKQVFVVLLEVQQAVSSHLITISRNNSTCVIIDNEGELIFNIWPMAVSFVLSVCLFVCSFICFVGVFCCFVFPRCSNWIFTSYLHC